MGVGWAQVYQWIVPDGGTSFGPEVSSVEKWCLSELVV